MAQRKIKETAKASWTRRLLQLKKAELEQEAYTNRMLIDYMDHIRFRMWNNKVAEETTIHMDAIKNYVKKNYKNKQEQEEKMYD